MFYAIDLHPNNFVVGYKSGLKVITRKYYLTTISFNSFKSLLTKDDIIAVESTGNSYFFFDEIAPLVKEVKIINPLKFKIISESTSKTDKNDVKAIIEFMERDLIPQITIPPKHIRELRGLFSTYKLLVKEKTMLKNRVTAIIISNGKKINATDSFGIKGKKEILSLSLPEKDKLQITTMLKLISSLEEEVKIVKNKILEYSVFYKGEIEILLTINGMSTLIALGFLTDIGGNINNFSKPGKLCSYLGIVPKVKSSNAKTWRGKITKKGRSLSRGLLSQALFHFIRSSDVYKEFYQRKKKEKCAKIAMVAMLRRMVVVMYYMLKRKELYHRVQEKTYKNKLNEWLKIINRIRSMDSKDLDDWELKIRRKYDLEFNEKLIKKKNIA